MPIKPIGSPLILSGHDLADRLALRCIFNQSFGRSGISNQYPVRLTNLVNGNVSSEITGGNTHQNTQEDGGAIGGTASFSFGTFGQDNRTADLALAPFTLMARISNGVLSYANGIAERNDANSVNAGWMATVTGGIGLTVEYSSSNMQAFASPSLPGGYYWATFVYDGTAIAANQKIYINGVPVTVSGTNGSGSQGSDAANSLLIGSATFNPSGFAFSHGPWNGGMSDLSIWRRALSNGEILEYIRDPYCMLALPISKRARHNFSFTGDLSVSLTESIKVQDTVTASAAIMIRDVQQATHNASTNTLTLPAFAVDPANGDTVIVAYAVWSLAGNQVAPTDSTGSNVYTRIGSEVAHNSWIIGLWYARNIVGGSSFTVTGHVTTNDYHTVIAWLISGDYTYNSDFASSGSSGHASPITSGTSSPAPAGEALFIGVLSLGLAAATEGTDWNITGLNGFTPTMKTNASLPSFANIDLHTEYIIATAIAQSAPWTISGTADYNALVASFSKTPPADLSIAVSQEALKISDTVTAGQNITVSVTESLKISDVFLGFEDTIQTIQTESLKVRDTLITLIDPSNIVLTESIKISDTLTTKIDPGNIVLSESVKVHDTPTTSIDPGNIVLSEQVKVHDTPTVAMDLVRSVSESLKVHDTVIVPAKTGVTQHLATVIRAQIPKTRVTQHLATVLRIPDPCAVSVTYEDPCTITTPEFWIAIADENGNVTQVSSKPLNDISSYYGGYKEPRLTSIAGISRIASDWLTRSWQAQTATVNLADTDREYRGLTRGDLTGAQLYAYLVDNASRRSHRYQRLLFQGPVFNDDLSEDLTVQITANDVISIDYSLFADEKMIPQRVVSTIDFPNCASAGSLGFAVPIVFGDVINLDVDQLGALKLFALGDVTINSLTKAAFMVCGHGVHGLTLYQGGIAIPDADTNAWWPYSSTWTDIVPSAAKIVTIGGHDYTLVLLDGWRKVAIDAGATLTKTSWTATTAYVVGNAVSPASNMVDGTGKFLLCKIAGTTGSSDTLTVPAIGATLVDGGVTWVAVSDQASPLYANINGFGTKSDGSGSQITDGIILAKYLLINFLLQSFKTGNWLPSPKFESYPGNGNFICRVDTLSFDIATEAANAYTSGGFLGAGVIGAGGKQESIRTIWANVLLSYNLMFSQSQYQQLKVVLFDSRRSKFLANNTSTVTDRWDILDTPKFKIQKKRDWLCNDMGYNYSPNLREDSRGTWNRFNSKGNAPSKVRYGVQTKTVQYLYVRDDDTANAVAQQQIDFRAQLRSLATYSQSLCGLKRDVLDGITVTHFGGRGSTGWKDNVCWILAQRLDQTNCSVSFDVIDVQDLMSDDTILRVTCPSHVDTTSSDGNPVVVTFADPVITGGRAPITGSYDHSSGGSFPVGTTVVTYNAVSADGQSKSCFFTITVVSTLSTFALTVVSGSGSGNYLAAARVPISANTPPMGQQFNDWTGATPDDSTAPITTLTMPAAPTIITANYGDIVVASGQLQFGWNANPDDESVEGYVVEWGIAPGVYTHSRDVGNILIYLLTGLVVGTTYYISIKAYNSLGFSGFSSEVSGVAVATP